MTVPPPVGSTAERERAAVLPSTASTHPIPDCAWCAKAMEQARVTAMCTGSTGAIAEYVGDSIPDGPHRAEWHRPTNDYTHIQPYPHGGSTP